MFCRAMAYTGIVCLILTGCAMEIEGEEGAADDAVREVGVVGEALTTKTSRSMPGYGSRTDWDGVTLFVSANGYVGHRVVIINNNAATLQVKNESYIKLTCTNGSESRDFTDRFSRKVRPNGDQWEYSKNCPSDFSELIITEVHIESSFL